MINLDQKYDDNECLFEGSFEDDDNSMVVVSSDDCPIDEDSELKAHEWILLLLYLLIRKITFSDFIHIWQ